MTTIIGRLRLAWAGRNLFLPLVQCHFGRIGMHLAKIEGYWGEACMPTLKHFNATVCAKAYCLEHSIPFSDSRRIIYH